MLLHRHLADLADIHGRAHIIGTCVHMCMNIMIILLCNLHGVNVKIPPVQLEILFELTEILLDTQLHTIALMEFKN